MAGRLKAWVQRKLERSDKYAVLRLRGGDGAEQAKLEDSNMANYGGKEMRDLRKAAAETEAEFKGAGAKVGIEIWRVENKPGDFGVKRWPKNQYGEFYSGDSYIVLNTYQEEGGKKLLYDVHFWLGKESTQDEEGVAAYKTVELDDLLNDLPIQHREVQGHESALFRSYFNKTGLTYLEGGHESGFRTVKPEDYSSYKRLFMFKREIEGVKVRTALRIEIPAKAENMNQGDVFVLDRGDKIYLWIGKEASAFEKFEAGLVVENIVHSRNGKSKKAPIDNDFWTALEGTEADVRGADKPYNVQAGTEVALDIENLKLYRISDASGEAKFTLEAEGRVDMRMLDTMDVFLIHANAGIWIWQGTGSTKQEKDKAFSFANQYIKDEKLPKYMPITVVKETRVLHSPLFRSLFAQ